MQKKFLVVLASMFLMVSSSGCIQQIRYNLKQVQSDVFGLHREVTVYSLDGKPIKTIDGTFKVLYPSSNRIEFIKGDGRKTTITGFYSAIIEEK